jgi:hypothetical protein
VDSPKFNCGCETGKSCFSSYDLARGAIKRFRRKRSAIKKDGSYLSVYRCKFCSCWHIGNTTKTLDNRRGPLKKSKTRNLREGSQARWEANLKEVARRLKEKADSEA